MRGPMAAAKAGNHTGGDVIGLKGFGGHGNVLTGTRHMVSAGHYTAAHAGFCILEAGGNAIDAGVAAGACRRS